jgi:hypothetical protein
VDFLKADYITDYEFDARFTHALFLNKLQSAGAQFLLNDLTLDEWEWLAELKNAITEINNGK